MVSFFLGFEEGYIAKDDGAQLIIAKCKDVTDKVSIRMTSYCFNHLAIWYDGEEAYRNVKSATTESDAAEIECSNAPAHKIGTRFFKQNPNLNQISPPQKLVPDGTHNNTNSFHKFLALESLSGEKMDESLIQVVNNIRQENARKMFEESIGVAVQGTDDKEVEHWSNNFFSGVVDGAKDIYAKIKKTIEDSMVYVASIWLLVLLLVMLIAIGKHLIAGNWLKLFKVIVSPILILFKWGLFWFREFEIVKDISKNIDKVKNYKLKSLKKKMKKAKMNRKKNGKKKRKESDFDSDTEYEDMCFDDKL